jgi:hypothetical protein
MPWYKTGTVSVVLNSNAVIGTGTAFLSNGRVGDAFRGPDGGWYEVTNIASDTAMSISPNYKGVTNAAGGYALAPMQGYVKDSADALRALVNTYGAKLAALGTTGNYDVLPLASGGTGATTLAAAQLALGASTSPLDATPGSLVRYGGFGLGLAIVQTGADLNTVVTGNFYFMNGCTNGPGVADGWLFVQPINSNYCVQHFTSSSTGITSDRVMLGGVWGGWSGRAKQGANADITSLSGLTTALSVGQGGTGRGTVAGFLGDLVGAGAYWKGNILGTVGVSGGVPTGAIIESGSNSAGTYTKFADGTLIATIFNAGPWSVLANTVTVLGPFGTPAVFTGANYSVAAQAAPSATNDTYGVVASYPVSTTSCSFVFRNGATAQNLSNIKLTCIGRWY